MFSLVLFPFPFHSHWLFPFPPAPILVLPVVSHQITNDRWTWQCTESTVIKRKKIQPNPQKYTSSIKASSVSWTSRVKPNLRVYDKLGLLCKNKSGLTVFDHFLRLRGCHHQLPHRVTPILLMPLVFNFAVMKKTYKVQNKKVRRTTHGTRVQVTIRTNIYFTINWSLLFKLGQLGTQAL